MTSINSSHHTIKRVYQILAGKLFDPLSRTLALNQVITVDRDVGIVLDVKSELEVEASGNEFGQNVEITKIDLRHLVILPGLIDVHVHCEFSFSACVVPQIDADKQCSFIRTLRSHGRIN